MNKLISTDFIRFLHFSFSRHCHGTQNILDSITLSAGMTMSSRTTSCCTEKSFIIRTETMP